MSILDSAPKTSVRLLVGREKELREVVRSVVDHRVTVVLGPRRVGKTSLVKTALSVLSGKERLEGFELLSRFIPVYIDMWAIVSTSRSRDYFFRYLCDVVDRALEEYGGSVSKEYRERMHLVEEVSVKEGGVDTFLRGVYAKEKKLVFRSRVEQCLEHFDSVLGKYGVKAILVIDEAQELGTIKPFSPTTWLAHIHDHLTNIHVLLSGSYVGLLKRVLRPGPKDPLYGRDIHRLYIGKLDPKSLLEIFVKGLEERGIKPSIELSNSLKWVTETLKSARFAQLLPLAESTSISKTRRESTVGKPQDSRVFEKTLLYDVLFTLIMLMELLTGLKLGILSSILVYISANILIDIGFDAVAFSLTLTEEKRGLTNQFIELLNTPGTKALMVLSFFTLSGSPHMVIYLAKKLPQNFNEEDLFKAGLEVLEESYRAVCSEINNFIASYSRKPEIMTTILYSLYEGPKTTGELVKILADVEKKSVVENLKTLIELGYISKVEEKPYTYYYITDPLLFYAIKEKCVEPPHS